MGLLLSAEAIASNSWLNYINFPRFLLPILGIWFESKNEKNIKFKTKEGVFCYNNTGYYHSNPSPKA